MIPIKRLGHFVLRVANIERSKLFYTELLGMHVLEQDPRHGGIFLGLGEWGNTLDLMQSSDPSAESPHSDISLAGVGFHHAAFAVDSPEILRDGYFILRDHGVPILGAFDHQSQQSVYFSDPDGNILEIYWERPNALEIFRKGRRDSDTPLIFERSEAR
jgi:catechol 2,3-dioxygenase